ncbi:MAG: hypothetical protein QXD77_02235, partial [Candidatus Aenigmatarchaeota archaeon]
MRNGWLRAVVWAVCFFALIGSAGMASDIWIGTWNAVDGVQYKQSAYDGSQVDYYFRHYGTEAMDSCHAVLYIDGIPANETDIVKNTDYSLRSNFTLSEGRHDWYITCSNGTMSLSSYNSISIDKTAPVLSAYTSGTNGVYWG